MAGDGDCKVFCDGREVGQAYHFDKTNQEGECICLSLLPVHRKGEKQKPCPSKQQLIAKLNLVLEKRKNDRVPKKTATKKIKKL
jgi:hypothetical protein